MARAEARVGQALAHDGQGVTPSGVFFLAITRSDDEQKILVFIPVKEIYLHLNEITAT